jgi:dihydroflavonol-4-reductase
MGPLVRWMTGWSGDMLGVMFGQEVAINSAGIRITSDFHFHDSSRARAELGYQTRDPAESLDALNQWIREHHLS